MSPWFIYNCLHLALVALARGNLYAAEQFVRQVHPPA
jgi:hypothetical protein